MEIENPHAHYVLSLERKISKMRDQLIQANDLILYLSEELAKLQIELRSKC
jgi:hypothetical protein